MKKSTVQKDLRGCIDLIDKQMKVDAVLGTKSESLEDLRAAVEYIIQGIALDDEDTRARLQLFVTGLPSYIKSHLPNSTIEYFTDRPSIFQNSWSGEEA